MRKATLTSVAAIAVWTWTASASALPPAVFDCGGTAFDLERASAARFKVPGYGLTGSVERKSPADSDEPAVAALDWKGTSHLGPRKVSLRYRLRVDRYPDDRKHEVRLQWRKCKKGADGKSVVLEGCPRYRISDTSGGWREVCLPDFYAPSDTETVEFLFGLNGCLGKLEYKDLTVTADEPRVPNELVELAIRPSTFVDGTFELSRGQPQHVYLVWRSHNCFYHRKYAKQGEWSATLDLPAGVRCLAIDEEDKFAYKVEERADGSSRVSFVARIDAVPKGDWPHWFHTTVLLVSDLPAGSRPGAGVFNAYYKGAVAAKPAHVWFSVGEPVRAARVPKRYLNGIVIGSSKSNFLFSDASAADRLAAFYCDAGVRSCTGGPAEFQAMLRKHGAVRFTSSYPRIVNGYSVNPPEGGADRPADQRFVPYEEKFLKNPQIANATCPVAVYEEDSFFRERIVPTLKQELAGYRGFEANWEPDGFFRKGCACKRCCAAFAKFLGRDAADVARDWPACIREGGRFADRAEKFRAVEHGKLVKTLHRHVCAFSGGDRSEGLIPEIVWSELADALKYDERQGEVDPREYLGALRWVNPWGPYVWWDLTTPYFYEKRLPVASYVAARAVRERVDRDYGRGKLKLVAFPSGWQGKFWFATPEWIALSMDSFFFNAWEAVEMYKFPVGYDARFWRAYAGATERAARCEDYVIDGVRTDAQTVAEPVAEYAAPCREATGFLPQVTNVPTLQTPSYDLRGGRVVGVLNFWEKGVAFFTLRLSGLAPGAYTVVSEGKTLWTNRDGGVAWTADELAKGVFLAVGAARTVDFEIRPANEHAERRAVDEMSAAAIRALYGRLRPQLAAEAERDRAAEARRGLLYPDTLPEI